MEITFEKIVEEEVDGEIVKSFVECPEEEATHKKITYPESRREMNQERPGKRIEL